MSIKKMLTSADPFERRMGMVALHLESGPNAIEVRFDPPPAPPVLCSHCMAGAPREKWRQWRDAGVACDHSDCPMLPRETFSVGGKA